MSESEDGIQESPYPIFNNLRRVQVAVDRLFRQDFSPTATKTQAREVEPRRKGRTPNAERNQKILALKAKGETPSAIAARLGLVADQVKGVLRRSKGSE